MRDDLKIRSCHEMTGLGASVTSQGTARPFTCNLGTLSGNPTAMCETGIMRKQNQDEHESRKRKIIVNDIYEPDYGRAVSVSMGGEEA